MRNLEKNESSENQSHPFFYQMTSYVDDITVSALRQSEMVSLYECMEKFADV